MNRYKWLGVILYVASMAMAGLNAYWAIEDIRKGEDGLAAFYLVMIAYFLRQAFKTMDDEARS